MENTKKIAEIIVKTLENELSQINLPSIKCIYVPGSFSRGDWLNNSSDLDIHMIFAETNETRQNDLNIIYEIVEKAKDSKTFYSHTPGGIDYGFNEIINIPKTPEEALKPGPYPYFSTLMFDIKKYCKTIYGIDLYKFLPETPDPKKNIKEWLLILMERTKKLEMGNIKIPFNTYKMILGLQILYGENTINKYEILQLYEKNVPEFEMKWFGGIVIRNYLGSMYPGRPLASFENELYVNFMDDIVLELFNK
jgi:predicted nucleotidyltransferase